MPVDPFALDPTSTLLGRAAFGAVRPLLTRLLRLRTFRALYEGMDAGPSETFAERALRALDVRSTCPTTELARVPSTGPLIVVANHPHGALDGLVLAALIRQVRPDVRVVANYLLARIPELAETSFFVDPFAGPVAESRSRAGLRAAHLWLRRGGALIMFPAGEVSRARPGNGMPIDSDWRTTAVRLASRTGATIVPAFIEGANSGAFYAAGLLHERLQTLLLPRELLGARGRRVTVRIAEPIATTPIAVDASEGTELTGTVRQAVERLAERPTESSPISSRDQIAREIARLPQSARLLESGSLAVFCTGAQAIPETLREIGRLRAVTYRAAGEGTDADVDLDRFDNHYLHLFSWDHARQCIVGAYRIGRTDEILAAHGVEGLYTRTLFDYDERFLCALSPALELGRSFVRQEYQRDYHALLMLWKGIGRFVIAHPQYRILFGPVSISARYSDASHALLAAFLEQNHRASALADLVTPRQPLAPRPLPDAIDVRTCTVEEANRLVASLEADGKGMPVLLRQYLKLNAQAIGFNVDRAFGDVLDALMMVDLTTVDRAILNRYFGRDGAELLLSHHSRQNSPQAA